MALVLTPNTFSPPAVSHLGSATHYSNYGVGGLKTFDYSASNYGENQYGIDSIAPSRRSTGSIVYIGGSTNKYYMDRGIENGYAELSALTTGSPNFSSGLTASGIYVTSLGNIFLDGGNVATTGTASFSSVNASVGINTVDLVATGTNNNVGTITNGTWNGTTIAVNKGGTGQTTYTNGQLLIGNTTGGTLTKATLTQGTGVSITNGAGSITIAIGQSVATTVSPTFAGITLSNLTPNTLPIASTSGRLINSQITDNGTLITLGRATYINGNFQANGTVSATTGLSSSGYLAIGGNTQLGNAATAKTSVFGTLSIVNNESNSGSITCDSSGNLILDGSGISSGVQITDGLLWLGASSSTGLYIQSGSWAGTQPCGAISSSLKYIGQYGFANGTTDIQATFQVDKEGNLQCYSLKETSLREYKHQIQYITGSQLANIAKLRPITFLYNIDNPQDVNDTQLRQAGFIAQQVQQIYPEVAWYKDNKLAGLQYQRLTAYLTKGIQELAEQNKLLKSRVQSLEQLVNGILQGAK